MEHIHICCMYPTVLVMMVSVTSLATISCDRMMGVVRPFHNHLKPWQSIAIIFVIWTVSALLAVPFAVYRVFTVGKALRWTCWGERLHEGNIQGLN